MVSRTRKVRGMIMVVKQLDNLQCNVMYKVMYRHSFDAASW